jgi:hypothetical protein
VTTKSTQSAQSSSAILLRGYAVTSFVSQGKTADVVIAANAANAGNRAATSREQWYVSISRGRINVVVLTPDKTALRENAQRHRAHSE